MKSKRRHELQQNVLDAELAKVIEFFKKWGTHIAWGILIAALIVLLAFYNRNRRQRAAVELQGRYDQLITAPIGTADEIAQAIAGLEDLTEQDKDRAIAANAHVYLGSVYARLAISGSPADLALANQAPAAQAESYYTKVISEYTDQPLAVAKAYMGLGRLAEDRNDSASARSSYQAVLDMPEAKGFPAALAARQALEQLDSLSEPVPLATTAPADLVPATQPAPADGD